MIAVTLVSLFYITEVTGIAGFVKVRLLQKLGNRESQVIT